jgi:hypothetical protein
MSEGQHFLIVHEEPDDGMDVEHPADCPTDTIYGGDVQIHTCGVGRHADEFGLDMFFHRDEPHPHAFGYSQLVAPGRWPIEMWAERTWTELGWEYDAGLTLTEVDDAPSS